MIWAIEWLVGPIGYSSRGYSSLKWWTIHLFEIWYWYSVYWLFILKKFIWFNSFSSVLYLQSFLCVELSQFNTPRVPINWELIWTCALNLIDNCINNFVHSTHTNALLASIPKDQTNVWNKLNPFHAIIIHSNTSQIIRQKSLIGRDKSHRSSFPP